MVSDNKEQDEGRRSEALQRLAQSGRALSTAIILFHSALSHTVGLGPTEEKVLDLLEKNPGIHVGDLARIAAMPKNSLSDLLDRLQVKGFVSRRPSPSDGRRVIVEPTDAGRREIGQHFAGLMGALGTIYAEYSTEQLVLLSDFQERVARAQLEQARLLDGSTGEGPSWHDKGSGGSNSL